MPFVGSCSAAISVACRLPMEGMDAAYLPVLWGAVDVQEEVGCCILRALMFRLILRGKHTLEKGETVMENRNGPVSAKYNGNLVHDTVTILESKEHERRPGFTEVLFLSNAFRKNHFILPLTPTW